ncbi:MAG: TetR/AcrR family transcriptional regulator [Tannerellaceae bacterium]|jgi:AcrR family transcriptional regulator|nr:TetR/AcrR family transcriptional regulator [Tannerellaceae bacterium]
MEENNDIESRIIEAAKIVFVRKGYEATKMGDIATETGISRTSLHYYFRTKELLFEAIFGQLISMILPNVEIIMNEDSCILEKLPLIIDEYLAAIRQNPLFPVFVVNEMNRDPEHLFHAIMIHSKRIVPILRLREQIIVEMEKGLIRKRPLIDMASTLISLVVFPYLARHALTTAFLEGNREAFEIFLDQRVELIKEVMYNLLTPENK